MASSEVNVVREQVWSDALGLVGDSASAALALVSVKATLDGALEVMDADSPFRDPLESLLLSADLCASLVVLTMSERASQSGFDAVWAEFEEARDASS